MSEGQFRQVLDIELPKLRGVFTSIHLTNGSSIYLYVAACTELDITPAITVIVVGKRHHVRFFPADPSQADKSGNCKAGTVVDREITHPVELDFYLQSHAGLLERRGLRTTTCCTTITSSVPTRSRLSRSRCAMSTHAARARSQSQHRCTVSFH